MPIIILGFSSFVHLHQRRESDELYSLQAIKYNVRKQPHQGGGLTGSALLPVRNSEGEEGGIQKRQ